MRQSADEPISQTSFPLIKSEPVEAAAQDATNTGAEFDETPRRDAPTPDKIQHPNNGGIVRFRGHGEGENTLATLPDETGLMLGLISRQGLARIIEEVRVTKTPKVSLAADQLQAIENDLAKQLQTVAVERALESLQVIMVQDLGFAPGLLRRILAQRRDADPGKVKRRTKRKTSP